MCFMARCVLSFTWHKLWLSITFLIRIQMSCLNNFMPLAKIYSIATNLSLCNGKLKGGHDVWFNHTSHGCRKGVCKLIHVFCLCICLLSSENDLDSTLERSSPQVSDSSSARAEESWLLYQPRPHPRVLMYMQVSCLRGNTGCRHLARLSLCHCEGTDGWCTRVWESAWTYLCTHHCHLCSRPGVICISS